MKYRTQIALLILTFASVGMGQLIPAELTKLVPLETERAEVEKILGEPENKLPNFGVYRTDTGRFHVHYATGQCPQVSDGSTYWKVPKNRITNFSVYLNKRLPLAFYVSDPSRLAKTKSPGSIARFHYTSVDQSTIYETIIASDGSEFVYNITFQPARDKREHLCNYEK